MNDMTIETTKIDDGYCYYAQMWFRKEDGRAYTYNVVIPKSQCVSNDALKNLLLSTDTLSTTILTLIGIKEFDVYNLCRLFIGCVDEYKKIYLTDSIGLCDNMFTYGEE